MPLRGGGFSMADSVNLAGVDPEADSRRAESSTCSMVGVRTPFNLAEEAWQFRHPLDETPNIQLELRFSGSLDGHDLRRAILAAVAVHPMTRARKVAGRALLCPPRWVIEEPEVGDALRSIRCRDESELSAARDAFYNQTIDLGKAPALRFLLAHLPGGDALLLNVHHSVADGLGSLRFLHSVARAYGGRPDPAPLIDPLAVRDIKAYFGSAASRRDGKVNPMPSPTGRRAFLAPGGARGEPGFGFRHVALSHEDCRGLDPHRLEPSATVNDLLLAALHRAIGEWNTRRCHPCDCVAVFMPVNFRPSEWRHEVAANLTGGGMVTSMPDQRSSGETLMRSVASQTRWIKDRISSMEALTFP